MKDIFSRRLKSARIQAGLSQDQLVDRMGHTISKNAISKYEQGEMMADSEVLLSLAKALEVKVDFFFRPFSVEISQVEFRKKSRLTIKELSSIKQKVADSIERYVELERFLNIDYNFVNPISEIKISSAEDVEIAVEKLLFDWQLGFNALPGVIDMLEDNGIRVLELDASDAFDGLSGWADENIPVVVINKNYPVERKRLTALHELGHLLLNFAEGFSDNEIEKFCFLFAGAILMPRSTFKKELGEHRSHFSMPELIVIKETYGISIQAIMARAKGLGIINDSRYLNFCKYISRNRAEIGLGTYPGREHAIRFKLLLYRAAAEEIISMSKAANLSNLKLAEFRKDFIAL